MTLRQLWWMWEAKLEHERHLFFGAPQQSKTERIPYNPDVLGDVLNKAFGG